MSRSVPGSKSAVVRAAVVCRMETWHVPDRPTCSLRAFSRRSVRSTISRFFRVFIASRCIKSFDLNNRRKPGRLPSRFHAVLGILLVEPFLDGGKVVDDRGGVHLTLACHEVQCLRPRPAASHLQHLLESRSSNLVVVD